MATMTTSLTKDQALLIVKFAKDEYITLKNKLSVGSYAYLENETKDEEKHESLYDKIDYILAELDKIEFSLEDSLDAKIPASIFVNNIFRLIPSKYNIERDIQLIANNRTLPVEYMLKKQENEKLCSPIISDDYIPPRKVDELIHARKSFGIELEQNMTRKN